MDIKELEAFSLSDAVKFHDELNPRLWQGDDLLPEVRKQLKTIAQDFITYMGISSDIVKDITISGSNAAYTYTDQSDIDLHIMIDMDALPESDIYKELFNSKKSLYNDRYDITIKDTPVELYVQDSKQKSVTTGEYSVLKDAWLKFPTKRKASLDQTSTKAKYEKLGEMIELAISNDDLDKVKQVVSIIKRYRQAGLSKAGEFGPENLAFKALRTTGLIGKLMKHRDHLKSSKLSIEEQIIEDEPEKKLSDHEKLEQAAGDQRGGPELAMVAAQHVLGGGVVPFVIEHVGDLYNRMHNTGYGDLGDHYADEERRQTVLEKIRKTLRTLTQGYGFEREHLENMRVSAQMGNKDYDEHVEKVSKALKKYADEHSKLPVYNKAQKYARAASIALGMQDWDAAATYLFRLRDLADDKQKWHETINVIDPSLSQINEVFDTKLTKANKPRWHSGGAATHTLDFYIPSNKSKYELNFFNFYDLGGDVAPEKAPDELLDDDDWMDNGRIVDFELVQGPKGSGYTGSDFEGTQAITGTGSQYEVFSIVTNAVLDYVKKYKTTWLVFHAREPSRRKLYKAMVRRMLVQLPGWKGSGPNRQGQFEMWNTKIPKSSVNKKDKWLEEVFDTQLSAKNKPQWKWIDRFAEVEFKVSNGQIYNLQAYPALEADPFDDLMSGAIEKLKKEYPLDDDKYWKRYYKNGLYIHFIQVNNDKESLTIKDKIEGTGAAAEVFSLVVDALTKIVKRLKPSFLIFGARESSRRSLYKRMIRSLAPTLGYKFLDVSDLPHSFSNEIEAYFIYRVPEDVSAVRDVAENVLNEVSSDEAWELVGQPVPEIQRFVKQMGYSDDKQSVEKITSIIDKAPTTQIPAAIIPKLKNLANKGNDNQTLKAVQKISGRPDAEQQYIKLMQARDSGEGRKRDVSGYLQYVKSGNYDPPILLKLPSGLYVIGGRTRLYATIALGVPATVKILDDNSFKQDVAEGRVRYKEIEFVCANPEFDDATDPVKQKQLYKELTNIPGVIPLYQDQGEYSKGQMSLTAIFKDPQAKKQILQAAKKIGVLVDLEQEVSDDYVDRAIRGEHEGQIQGVAEGNLDEQEGSTTSLERLYNSDYPDHDELFWNYVNRGDEDKPLQIKTMPKHMVKIMLLSQYRAEHIDELLDMMEEDQKEIVDRYTNDPSLANKIIVVADKRIIDGNHRALAAAIKGTSIRYVDVAELDDESLAEGEDLLDKLTMGVSKLAKKHNVSEKHIIDQLKKGIKVELEHTNTKKIAKEIALDHLGEDPNYYTKLSSLKLEGASGYIPSKKEANDPRFKTALTVDVKPDTIQKNAKAFGFKVSRAGIPPKLRK